MRCHPQCIAYRIRLNFNVNNIVTSELLKERLFFLHEYIQTKCLRENLDRKKNSKHFWTLTYLSNPLYLKGWTFFFWRIKKLDANTLACIQYIEYFYVKENLSICYSGWALVAICYNIGMIYNFTNFTAKIRQTEQRASVRFSCYLFVQLPNMRITI